MELTALAGLAVLALIDSTSFGTLGVPVWMLVQPRVRVAAVLTHLGVIAAFYWVLGLVLLLGAGAIRGAAASLSDLTHSRPFLIGQLVVGVALFLASFGFTRKRGEARRARRAGRPTRVERLTARAVGEDASLRTVTAVAVGAGVIEAASMLPYLGAIGLLTAAGTSYAASAGLLAAYVIVMVVPALALLGLRLAVHDRVTPLLQRVNAWMQRNKDEMLGWVLGILGFFIATDAFQRLQSLG